jgi:hypothetical protein
MIRITSDYSDIFKELDRVESMPDIPMVARLDAVLTVGFETSRAAVHVDTGKLKASGKKKSSTNKAVHEWKGQFSFPAKTSQGVSYGIYERERGGDHDFLIGVHALIPLFKAALLKGLKK